MPLPMEVSVMKTRQLNRLYDVALFSLVILFLLVVPANFIVIDDAYVYFNYARNFAEGRPFAYDPRNIPSEGFTSILYMLLLVPAEALKINPILASSIIHILSLALSFVWLGQLVRASGVLPSHFAALFVGVLAALALSDVSLRLLVFSGFEAVLGLLCTMGIILSVAHALNEQHSESVRKRWTSLFFVASFLAHLVRPEYLLIGGLGGVLLLWRSADRAALLRLTAVFAFVMLGYYLFKLLIFGDLFPTGFYRKVRASSLGLEYVVVWLGSYSRLFLVSLAGLAIITASTSRRRQWWLVLLIAGAASIVIFYVWSTPISDFANRFLIVPTWTLYTVAALGATLLIFRASQWLVAQQFSVHLARHAWLKPLITALAIAIFWGGLLPKPIAEAVNSVSAGELLGIAKRADQKLNENHYVQIGRYWREQLGDPSTITLAHVEAGALPYVLGSRFIDLLGLVEPPIARMFGKLETPEEVETYIQYILEQEPDVVIIHNPVYFSESTTTPNYGLQSPFLGADPIALYQAYQDYGLVYGCSVANNDNVWTIGHVLLRRTDEAHFSRLFKAFCSHPKAHRLSHGVTVVLPDGKVHFPSDALPNSDLQELGRSLRPAR